MPNATEEPIDLQPAFPYKINFYPLRLDVVYIHNVNKILLVPGLDMTDKVSNIVKRMESEGDYHISVDPFFGNNWVFYPESSPDILNNSYKLINQIKREGNVPHTTVPQKTIARLIV
jgi:hypothetical protein